MRDAPVPVVLNVDDDLAGRTHKTALLQSEGFAVVEAANGQSAIDLAARHQPALVLLDIQLPDIDGYAVCRAIRRLEGDPIPIVHITAHCLSLDDWRRSVDCGADRYLTQPVDPDVLVDTVRGLVDRMEITRATRRQVDELEEQLRQAQKMEAVGQLAGGIAHDFNNMLTAIIGYTEMALEQFDETKPIYQDLREVLRAAESAAGLTRKLLAFSRKQVLKLRRVDPGVLIPEAVAMLRRMLLARVQLVVDVQDRVWPILADGAQLEQVLMNLAINAQDAMPDGGTLTIRVRNVVIDDPIPSVPVAAGDYVLVEVSDTGVGMDDATSERIFEPFFTTKPAGSGTGLGLAMVYGTVKQLHGYVGVVSETGLGSTFSLYLPRAGQAAPAATPAHERIAPPLGRERIVLVDDDPLVRGLAEKVLRRHGYRVAARHDADAALQLATAPDSRPDLIVTDLMMPGLTGAELVRQLRERGIMTPVIVMSGYSRKPEGTAADLPHVAWLAKPFTPLALLRIVREMIDQRVDA